jgi:hypothetical protein
LDLPNAFHKVFSTCGGYHVEIDTRADHHYDATGLGRVHRVSAPSELGLSTPIVADPNYLVSVDAALRNVALGPGWLDGEGIIHWLADYSGEIEGIPVAIQRESRDRVEFSLDYKGGLHGCESVLEQYSMDDDGVVITDTVLGSIEGLLIQIPLLQTDGSEQAEINSTKTGFVVNYRNYKYSIKCLSPLNVDVFMESFSAPNRNGIYKIGCFKVKGNQIKYKIEIGGRV